MNVDVGKAIKELLFEHEVVILPGLGGFTASPAVAAVDYVQGTVQPPSKKLEFNTNLVINDGILVHHIQQSEVITAQEANEAIELYIEDIKNALEKREIIDISEVGRLYKDYEQKIRFMPESTNFSVEAFGLPAVSFNPVLREKVVQKTVPPTKTVIKKPKAKINPVFPAKMEESWAEKLLPWLIGLAAILLALSIFLYAFDGKKKVAEVPQERVNVKPAPEEPNNNQVDTPIADEKVGNEADQGNATNPNTETQEATEPEQNANPANSVSKTTAENGQEKTVDPVIPANKKTKFIVIHSFGEKSNARKFEQRLIRHNYVPSTKSRGGLYRVGVEITYENQSEIKAMVSELGKKFKSNPVPVDY